MPYRAQDSERYGPDHEHNTGNTEVQAALRDKITLDHTLANIRTGLDRDKAGTNAYISRCAAANERQSYRDIILLQHDELRKAQEDRNEIWCEKEKCKALYLQCQTKLHAAVTREKEGKTVTAALQKEKEVLEARAKHDERLADYYRGRFEELAEEVKALKMPRKEEEMVKKLRVLLKKIARMREYRYWAENSRSELVVRVFFAR